MPTVLVAAVLMFTVPPLQMVAADALMAGTGTGITVIVATLDSTGGQVPLVKRTLYAVVTLGLNEFKVEFNSATDAMPVPTVE